MSKKIVLFVFLILCSAIVMFGQISANPPAFSINCPKDIVEGDKPVYLKVSAETEFGDEVSYDWRISDGEISAGQGTPSIEIIAGEAVFITATVEINSDVFMTATISCSFEVRQTPESVLTFEFNYSTSSNAKSMFDSFLIELINVPGSQGYVFIFPSSDKSYSQIVKLLKDRMKRHREFHTQLTFVRGEKKTPSYLQFWLVPFGAEAPVPEVSKKEEEVEPE